LSIKTEDLTFSYENHEVLTGVSFEADYGTFVSVLGPNGVGKSTLFRCMLGLLQPSRGHTYIDGTDIAAFSAAQMAKSVAYIPQSHSPVFNFSVFDMVLMGTTSQLGKFSSPGALQKKRAKEALERLDIAHLTDRGYRNISGGERQLVLIARAIAQQAKILIMDEPSANLDFGNRIKVMDEVKSLSREGYTVIQSTHDPEQAYQYSDRILAMYGGSVLAYGTPVETVTDDIMSTLYSRQVEVCSLKGDAIRVCVPVKA